MADTKDVQRDLQTLAADLKRLEAEYNMYFSGRLPRPPWETRSRVESLIRRYDRGHITQTGDRFRFDTLRSRFQSLIELWERGLRARDEGRPGPFVGRLKRRPPGSPEPEQKLLHVAAFKDPPREMEKLHTLYDSLMDARRQNGEEMVPFHKFAALITSQVTKMREAGSSEVAFRVAVRGGKVAFTARGMKDASE